MLKFPVLPSRDITPEDLKGCQGFSGETRVFSFFFFESAGYGGFCRCQRPQNMFAANVGFIIFCLDNASTYEHINTPTLPLTHGQRTDIHIKMLHTFWGPTRLNKLASLGCLHVCDCECGVVLTFLVEECLQLVMNGPNSFFKWNNRTAL